MSDERTIYCVPIEPHALAGVDISKICWGSCGQGLVGGVDVMGFACIPCATDAGECPRYHRQTETLGHDDINGETVQVVMRMLGGEDE